MQCPLFPEYPVGELDDAITRRFSCRNYSPTREVEPEKLAKLERIVESLNKVSPDVQLVLVDLKDYPKAFASPIFLKFIKNVRRALLIRCRTAAARPAADVLIGYLGEMFVLYATAIGLNTVWIGGLGFMCKVGQLDEAAGVAEPKEKGKDPEAYTAITIPFGYATDPTFVAHKKKELKNVYDGPIPADTALLRAAENLRLAPTAMNRSPFLFRFGFADRGVEAREGEAGKDDVTGITIRPASDVSLKDKPNSIHHCNAWLDCGIVAAHADISLRALAGKAVKVAIPAAPSDPAIELTYA